MKMIFLSRLIQQFQSGLADVDNQEVKPYHVWFWRIQIVHLLIPLLLTFSHYIRVSASKVCHRDRHTVCVSVSALVCAYTVCMDEELGSRFNVLTHVSALSLVWKACIRSDGHTNMPHGHTAASCHLLIVMSSHRSLKPQVYLWVCVFVSFWLFIKFYTFLIVLAFHSCYAPPVITFSCPLLSALLPILWSVSFYVAPSLSS